VCLRTYGGHSQGRMQVSTNPLDPENTTSNNHSKFVTTQSYIENLMSKPKHMYWGIFTLAHRSICSRCVNLHFEVSKNSKIIFLCTSTHFMFVHKFSKKIIKICGSSKKDKFWCYNTTTYRTFFYLFCTRHIKFCFSMKTCALT
jgi:hypothetical protein